MADAEFARLRPICVSLTQMNSREKLKELVDTLKDCSLQGLQNLQEYVLFPLRLIMKKGPESSNDILCQVIEAITFILQKTSIHRQELFQDVFNCICFSLSNPNDVGTVRNLSEEYKEASVNCLCALFRCISDHVVASVYTAEWMPAMGHLVTLLLHLTENERKRELRTASMNCLLASAQSHRKMSGSQERAVADIFAAFLPGISMSLCRVITGDSKQGHGITCTAIKAWRTLVCLVMDDSSLQETYSASITTKDSVVNPRISSLLVKRTEEWTKGTSEKLMVLTERIKALASHSNWRVRLAMCEWSTQLVTHCQRSLSGSMPHCLEVLVGLLGDEYPNIATASESSLQKFQSDSVDNLGNSLTLLPILQENLHSLITELPRLIRCVDETEKLQMMRKFHGYIKLLSAHLETMFFSYAHLHRLSRCLLQILEFDCSSIDVIQEQTAENGNLGTDQAINLPRKQFLHFRDIHILQEIKMLCRILGRHGNIEILVDHFLDHFHQTSLHRKQSILIINELCLGLVEVPSDTENDAWKKKLDADQVNNIIRTILDVYLSSEYLYMKITNQKPEISQEGALESSWQIVEKRRFSADDSSLIDLNSNIVTVCLILEGIGIISRVVETDIEVYLLEILYPLLEKIGSSNAAISQTAFFSLHQVAVSFQYSGISELLCKNADYLVNAISLRMRHLSRYPGAPSVLCVILEHGDSTVLPLMEDTILEVLAALDEHYDKAALPFMRILLSLVTFIAKWFPTNVEEKVKTGQSKEEKFDCSKDVKHYLTEYIRNKHIASGKETSIDEEQANDEHRKESEMTAEEENADEVTADDEKEDEKPEPYHVTKLKQVLERCIHLLTAPDAMVRLVTLDTIAVGLIALQDHQNILLPLIHKLWPSLVPRFTDKEMLVILKACNVLGVFAEVSKDFIRQRVTKDVFPKLIVFLKKQYSVSLNAGAIYHHSLGCKLQLAMLRDVGRLCGLLSVGEQHLHTVMCACAPYLSARQPRILQQACLQTFQEFAKLEPDTVWLLCNELYCDEDFQTPTGFPPVKFKAQQNKEFKENITAILETVL